MIEAVTKLVQIQPASADDRAQIANLESLDARKALAKLLQRDIDQWCEIAFDDGPRSHLGASIIGRECARDIWYMFRWIKHKVHSGQQQRLFQRGHLEEDRVIQYLVGIGCAVQQVAYDTQEQKRIYAVRGHFGGSTDGGAYLPASYGIDLCFLLEIKTANKSEFGKMKSIVEDKPEHFKQISVYGFHLHLEYCIYVMVCKDNDEMYIEIVKLDFDEARRLIKRAEHIIYAHLPPPRISSNSSFWKCKMCDHHGVCQLGHPIDQNCRSCYYSLPSSVDKTWHCHGWKTNGQPMVLDKATQLRGCQQWTARTI